jgi:hypothetical protein
LVPVPHWVPLCIQGPHPKVRWIPLCIKLSTGPWWDLLPVIRGCTPVTKEVITHHLHNPGKWAPKKCCGSFKLRRYSCSRYMCLFNSTLNTYFFAKPQENKRQGIRNIDSAAHNQTLKQQKQLNDRNQY